MFRILYASTLALALLATIGCGSDADVTESSLYNVPASAAMVSAIDLEELSEEINLQDVLGGMSGGSTDWMASKWQAIAADFKGSGIALTSEMYNFVDVNPKNQNDMLAASSISLADASAFGKAVSTGEQVVKVDGVNIILDGESFVAWNDKSALLGVATRSNPTERIAALFKQDKTTSVASNSDLMKAIGNDHDFSAWVNFEPFVANMPPNAAMGLGMAGFSVDDLADNTIHTFGDVEGDELTMESRYFVNSNLKREFDLLFHQEVETDFREYLPGENLQSLMLVSFDFKGTRELLKQRNFEAFVNGYLSSYGVTVEKIAQALQGDMALAYVKEGEALVGVFAAKVDPDAIQEFIAAGINYQMIAPAGNNRYNITGAAGSLSGGAGTPGVLLHEGMLFMSNSSAMLDRIADGGFGSDAVDDDLYDSMKNNIFSLKLNTNELSSPIGNTSDLDFEELTIQVGRERSKLKIKSDNDQLLKSLLETVQKGGLPTGINL